MARVDAEPLPYPVAQDEPGVEYRHRRPLAGHELSVDPHPEALVTRIVLEVMRAVGHGSKRMGRDRLTHRACASPLAQPPAENALGMDPDQRGGHGYGLRPPADLDGPGSPGVRALQIIDHDRRPTAV